MQRAGSNCLLGNGNGKVMGILNSDALKRQLKVPAVYGFLVHYCLSDLSAHLAESIMKRWGIDEDALDRLVLRAYPTQIQNLIASKACADEFGDLSTVRGFYLCNDVWWLDLDPRWSGNGFLMPVRDGRRRWFSGLFAFRGPSDDRPFSVRVRGERAAA